MLAIYLAPVYILLNLYVLRWSYLWIGNCHHLFQSTVFRVILAIVYVLISTTPLTGFLIKKPASLHRILKVTSNYFLGIFMYILMIVLIADTHFGYNAGTIHAKEIVKKINKQNPDLVCIAGDIFDNEYEAIHEPKKVKKILRKINSRYGVYACWGNHDLNEPILAGFTFNPGKEGAESLKDPRMREFLKDSNIQLLEDEAVLIDNSFYVVGRKDASLIEKIEEKRKTPAQLTEKLDKDKPIIFIDHQPKELQEIADAGVDLDLCGHTHDGQTFPGNITIKFLWENPCGYLQKGSMHNIVTSGSGVWGPAMRVGTNSEICTINVTFQNS